MTDEGAHFHSELKRWYNFRNQITERRKYKEHQKPEKESMVNQTSLKKFHQMALLILQILLILISFQICLCKLLILRATSPTGSTETERAASGIRQLKTPYRSTMGDMRKSDLL